MTVRVVMTENDFKKLISGAIVKLHGSDTTTVEVILLDLGYVKMVELIQDEVLAHDPYYFDPPID